MQRFIIKDGLILYQSLRTIKIELLAQAIKILKTATLRFKLGFS